MEKETKTISIPASLYKQIEDAVRDTAGTSVADFAASALREALEKKNAEVFSAEDEEKVKERLKALGYID